MSQNDWNAHVLTMEHHDPGVNSHKFYRVVVLHNDVLGDHRVLYQWGRVGTNGQSSFKIYGDKEVANRNANHRVDLKVRKGYSVHEAWQPEVEFYAIQNMLTLAGVNIHATGPAEQVQVDGGVTFDEMGTLVETLLSRAVTKENDTVDVMVEAATMNAKFAQLREQFENVESEVEFVNTAVRSRL